MSMLHIYFVYYRHWINLSWALLSHISIFWFCFFLILHLTKTLSFSQRSLQDFTTITFLPSVEHYIWHEKTEKYKKILCNSNQKEKSSMLAYIRRFITLLFLSFLICSSKYHNTKPMILFLFYYLYSREYDSNIFFSWETTTTFLFIVCLLLFLCFLFAVVLCIRNTDVS